MKIISIGTDRKLFQEGSPVLLRSALYAKKMEEMHIIVFSLESHGLSKTKVGNLYLYPTNSKSKISYIFDAIKIGRDIINELKLKFRNLEDVILSTQDPFETGLVGVRLKKIYKIPLQIQVHTDFISPYFKKGLLNFIRVSITNFTIKKADRLRVVSGPIKDSLIKNFKYSEDKIDILPIFVDVKKIKESEVILDLKKEYPQFKNIVFMASRLENEKRIDVAIKSFSSVLEKYPKTGLVIAGSGSQLDYLKKLVEKYKLRHKVIFIGWAEDVVSCLKSSDIFLLTSEYEGYGMALLEAGASGVPIVSTNVGLAKTPLFENGINSFICQVGDYKCLSDSISKLLGSEELRDLFRGRMYKVFFEKDFSLDDYVLEYVNILKKCLVK